MKTLTKEINGHKIEYTVEKATYDDAANPWHVYTKTYDYTKLTRKLGYCNILNAVIIAKWQDNKRKFMLYLHLNDYLRGGPPLIDGTKKMCMEHFFLMDVDSKNFVIRMSPYLDKAIEADKYKALYERALGALEAIDVLCGRRDNYRPVKAIKGVVTATGMIKEE